MLSRWLHRGPTLAAAAFALVVLGLVVVAAVQPSPPTSGASGVAAVVSPIMSPSTDAEAPPPWPAEVTAEAKPTKVEGGYSCARPPGSRRVVNVDPQMPYPTAALLASKFPTVVVATAHDSAGYWARGDGAIYGTDLVASTYTRYRVTRVVKGQAGAWVGATQAAADPSTLPCGGLVPEIRYDPLPVGGQEYLLLVGGQTPPYIGSGERYEIKDGKVYSGPQYRYWVQGQPLADFIASLHV